MEKQQKEEKSKKKKLLLILLLLLLFLGFLLIPKLINKNYVKKHTLTIDLSNNEINSGLVIELKPGETHELEIPKKDGYVFKNWVVEDGNSTIENNILTMGTEASKITVNWEIENYEITYDLNGGIQTNTPVTNYNVETETIKLENPKKEYYIFTGWTGSNGETPQTDLEIKKGSTGNKNYKANWKAITYEITYNLNEGVQGTNAITKFNIETESFNLPIPTRNGYVFLGWYNNKELKGEVQTRIEKGTHENKEYYAKWEIIPYTVIYNLAGGTLKNNPVTNYNVGTKTFELENPTKEYYIFKGWTGSNGTTPNKKVIVSIGSIGNREYIANWSPITYEITYNVNGGTLEKNIKDSYNVETASFDLPIPTRKGYTFLGWYSNKEFMGEVQTKIEKGTHENKEYYAKWSLNNYEINYDLNGGNQTNTPVTNYNVETETIKLENPTRKHYVFKGWTGSNGTTPQINISILKGSIGDKQYKANWTPITYSITYNLNDGIQSANAKTDYNIETESFYLPTPIKKGYNFIGWYETEDFSGDIITKIEKGSHGAKVYYAKWEVINYTITYNLDGGTLKDTAVKTYNIETEKVTLPIPTKKDYNFKGWYVTESLTGENEYLIKKGSVGNKEYYAKWEKIKSYVGYNTYDVLKDEAISDDQASLFVSNPQGIDFTKESNILNGHGKYLASDTKNDPYPIYYYRGDVDNNNIIVGGFCWKIIRTTETGGTKLIYNGVSENGKCDSTGVDTHIASKIKYNNSYSVFESIGYAYTKVHKSTSKNSSNLANGTIFANDIEVVDGKYVLKDKYLKDENYSETTLESILQTRHYTCFSTLDQPCSTVYYIYANRGMSLYYIPLTNGETLEDVLENKGFDPNNITNSAVKATIDNWYQTNMTPYTSYLEDTVFCNDRSVYFKGAWDKNGALVDKILFGPTGRLSNGEKPVLTCKNKNDRFTVSSSNGNGALTYPIALITADEAAYAGYGWFQEDSNSYLNNGQLWWTMSPSLISASIVYVDVIHSMIDNVHTAYTTSSAKLTSGGVRPVISLKNGVKIKEGTGTADNPFQVEAVIEEDK